MHSPPRSSSNTGISACVRISPPSYSGALQGQRAKKGVFITTSDFSRDAEEYARHIDTRIVLIDGSQLATLMIDYGVGVTAVITYEVKRLDSDYFDEGAV